MAKKRLKKKQQKKQLQEKLVQAGRSQKQTRKLTTAQLEQEYKVIVTQERRKEKERQRQAERRKVLKSQRSEKLSWIEKLTGTTADQFKKRPTARELDKLKLEDLQAGKYKVRDFDRFIPGGKAPEKFDFDKLYKVPDGKKIHFAFRSLNGDIDISDELARFNRYSNDELIGFITALVKAPLTSTRRQKGRRGKRTGSSGMAGQGMIKMNRQPALREVYQSQYNDDRRSNNFDKLRSRWAQQRGANYQHSNVDYHWQTIRQVDDEGRLKAYSEISARKLLVIGNAILQNIVETDRAGFYNDYKTVCLQVIPEMRNILP